MELNEVGAEKMHNAMVESLMSLSGASASNPYITLLDDLLLIPISHYLIAILLIFFSFIYHFLEFHFLHDLFTGFRGCSVAFTYHSSSLLFHDVVSKCRVLHSRYSVTPWLSSPHVQTVFLALFARAPRFNYRRELFRLSDGGTIALDWLMSSDVMGSDFDTTSDISKDDINPILLAIPGLTSDSEAPYIKHLAFNTARNGWNVVVTNHRGLGGVSITSDCFYNAGWTEDLRAVINHLHKEYPNAPVFVVGTSIGANILVKYLGEDGDSVPVAGALAICSPWDLLIGDRFISRRLLQKVYDRAIAIGLQGYAQLHQPIYSRLANWEGIKMSRSIRDFDHHATRLVGKFETVDTYYRRCSSASYVGNVSVPLLCISALDDPVCTREAIPWDECRANLNIVLATTKRGGHLAFFEGITAAGIWWVRAVDEFLKVLHHSPHMHVKKVASSNTPLIVDSSIDQGPYVNIAEDGMVAALVDEQVEDNRVEDILEPGEDKISSEQDQQMPQSESDYLAGVMQPSEQATAPLKVTAPVRRCIDLISRKSSWSLWLLVYIAIVTSWPVVGSVLQIALRKKLRNVLPGVFFKR